MGSSITHGLALPEVGVCFLRKAVAMVLRPFYLICLDLLARPWRSPDVEGWCEAPKRTPGRPEALFEARKVTEEKSSEKRACEGVLRLKHIFIIAPFWPTKNPHCVSVAGDFLVCIPRKMKWPV